ncbi:MAG: alpha-L-glutamate ligase-like protein [Gammaproteobacteria bacterium]|nr:alpha-L-glutamate ligase-like protein [Gammaproteobacteria bacterium]
MIRFATPAKLKKAGVVGMNRRNVVLIAQNNPRRLYPRVDDKLETKRITRGADITVPAMIGVARTQYHVRQLGEFLKDHKEFVIKPSKGSGGKGILVITRRDGGDFVKPSGTRISLKQLQHHVSNTLSGLYSLGGKPDVAMIEELVEFSDVFDGFSYEGVPDIRVILFHGYPVMAMTRLSTRESDGKANLHQGAVGLGIDIGTGQPLKAVQHGQPVEKHPDTGRKLSELKVPYWETLLKIASRCYEVTGLGYLGADIVLDKSRGPLLLELNARPGLAIQIANGMGMQSRLSLIDSQLDLDRTAEERVVYSMKVFGKQGS